MLLAALACALGLATVLFAVYRDEPLAPPVPAAPEWDVLPTPSDVGHGRFPLKFPGYDPTTVEVHLDALRRAYADLYAEAGPETLERARERAALRAGLEPEAPVRTVTVNDEPWEVPADGEGDALRLEAALSSVEPEPPDDAVPREHDRGATERDRP